MNNVDKFKDWLNTNLPSVRNGDIPFFASQARYYELDFEEAVSILHDYYGGTTSKKDQKRYLHTAWNW